MFEAVAGHGETSLVGHRFPSSRGIAGWVLVTRQPIAIEDPASDKRFASEVAASTGYTPGKLLACPLLHGERSVGVIEVLDPPASGACRPPTWTCWGCSRTRPPSRST